MNYKIIATDLDGTLLKSKMELSAENKAAIEKFTVMGGHFVPATGRSLSEVAHEVRALPEARYYITSNGAAVFDTKTGKAIIQNTIIGQEKAFLLETLRKTRSIFTIHFDGVSYVDLDRRDHDLYRAYRMSELFIQHIEDKDDFVGDFDRFCDEMESIESCCCFFESEEELEQCRAALLATGRFSVTASMPHNLEINSVRAGKGVALLELAKLLGIDPAATIGVGDSTNDMDNIQKAGLGLAVKNAHPDLLQIADRTICSNDEHIMDYILKNIIQ